MLIIVGKVEQPDSKTNRLKEETGMRKTMKWIGTEEDGNGEIENIDDQTREEIRKYLIGIWNLEK